MMQISRCEVIIVNRVRFGIGYFSVVFSYALKTIGKIKNNFFKILTRCNLLPENE